MQPPDRCQVLPMIKPRKRGERGSVGDGAARCGPVQHLGWGGAARVARLGGHNHARSVAAPGQLREARPDGAKVATGGGTARFKLSPRALFLCGIFSTFTYLASARWWRPTTMSWRG
uniref:Uncharacterized protein n=1 Tax=Oryza sativa subsp. japonica TaxID=39947 RepID=Q69X49_ORYSJ|nr:hypothetical protein [Oryza sativa Japonica Group]BAD32952.1 hypothetical protein [Oryza sativa Japonica Group]